ncbi:MAG: hypothetical protein QM754_11445 [Tepidisphaeraceae bacterium]
MTAAPARAISPTARASLRLAGVLVATWLLLLVIGFLAMRTPEALGAGHPVSSDRAAFVSANVGALTGFSIDFARPDDFKPAVRAIFVLQTISGVMLSLVGGGVLWARLLGRPYSDARLAGTALGMMIAAAGVGLFTIRPDESLLTGAMRGLCALGCTGSLFGDAVLPGSNAFKLVCVPLSVIGSFGVVIFSDLYDRARGRPVLIGHAGRVLMMTAVVYLGGVLWIGGVFRNANDGWRESLVQGDALTWAGHSLGVAAEGASRWPENTLTAVVAIAIIGVGSAGTAASFGLAWIWTGPRRLQAIITDGLVGQAMLASVTLASLAWMDTTLKTGERVLVAVSAVMNLGLSHDSLKLTGPGLFVLAASIIAAKLLPIVIFASGLLRKGKL